jgi:hypothetical protein
MMDREKRSAIIYYKIENRIESNILILIVESPYILGSKEIRFPRKSWEIY